MTTVGDGDEYAIEHDGIRFAGRRFGPRGDARGTVLLAPTVRGVAEFEAGRARVLAGLGYQVLVIDVYGESLAGASLDAKREAMQALRRDRRRLGGRLAAWVAAGRALSRGQDVAAVGYCFGGLCVLELARNGADLAGIASLHAVLDAETPSRSGRFPGQVLVLHGWEDPLAPPEAVVALAGELTALGADWQIHAYGNTLHAFTNPAAGDAQAGLIYNAIADRRSWASLTAFLAELFGG